MRFDLSFWDEPDWHRESTLSPGFTMFAIAAAFALAGVAMVSMTHRQLGKSKAQLSVLQAQNDAIETVAKQAAVRKKRVAEWAKVVAVHDALVAKNLPWSCQLEALQRLIPDDVILESLSVSSQRRGDTTDSSGKLPLPRFDNHLTLTGSAEAGSPQTAINTLLDGLEKNPVLGPLMKPELGPTSTRPDGSKQFKIHCRYLLR